MESGGDNWSVSGSGGGANFSLVATQSHSPTHAWFAPDPAAVSDRMVANAHALAITASTTFDFWHWYNTESSGTSFYDGVVLEYSLDNTNWVDILAANGAIPANAGRITTGGYTGTISSSFSSPIGGRKAWSGNSGAFVHVIVDVTDFVGQNVSFRWRMASDQSVGAGGYWLDDAPSAVATQCMLDDVIFKDGFEGVMH